jgi:hypothetical protein
MIMVYDVQLELTSIAPNHEGTKNCQARKGPGGIVLCDWIVSTCILVNKRLENLLRLLTPNVWKLQRHYRSRLVRAGFKKVSLTKGPRMGKPDLHEQPKSGRFWLFA